MIHSEEEPEIEPESTDSSSFLITHVWMFSAVRHCLKEKLFFPLTFEEISTVQEKNFMGLLYVFPPFILLLCFFINSHVLIAHPSNRFYGVQ